MDTIKKNELIELIKRHVDLVNMKALMVMENEGEMSEKIDRRSEEDQSRACGDKKNNFRDRARIRRNLKMSGADKTAPLFFLLTNEV